MFYILQHFSTLSIVLTQNKHQGNRKVAIIQRLQFILLEPMKIDVCNKKQRGVNTRAMGSGRESSHARKWFYYIAARFSYDPPQTFFICILWQKRVCNSIAFCPFCTAR